MMTKEDLFKIGLDPRSATYGDLIERLKKVKNKQVHESALELEKKAYQKHALNKRVPVELE